MLLEELTQLDGVSGNETLVRAFIQDKIRELADELYVDSIGNLIAIKKAKRTNKKSLKVMLAAHMDEVGFMVSGVENDGSLRFVQVGGIDERLIAGKTFTVGKHKIPAISFIAENVKSGNFDKKGLTMMDFRLDIGAKSRDEAEKHIEIGEYIAFSSNFTMMGNQCVMAKALDDRAGCSILMSLLEQRYDFELSACFTVQEEVGLRGAEVAAYQVNPDLAFVLEGTTCSDLSYVDPLEYSTTLGKGAAISVMDRSTLYNENMLHFISDAAQKHDCMIQTKNTYTGGNDSGKIQRAHKGVPVAVISVPVRYIHSPTSVMSLDDFHNMGQLVRVVLSEVNNFNWSK